MEVASQKKVRYVAQMVCLLFLMTAVTGVAQTWHSGGPGPNLIKISAPAGQDCSVTWYDPQMLTFPNGDLGFLAQGNNPRACSPPNGIDSLYKAQRDSSTLAWQVPSQTACPTLTGKFMNGSFPACPYSQTNPGPLASPSIVKIGNKYYMAFVGGNADYIRGHVYWAYSTDAVTWTVWKDTPLPSGYAWRPLIQPKYGDPCAPFGISQITLTYDANSTLGPEGAFYVHFLYKHPTSPVTRDMWAYRFPFSSSSSTGIGGGGQICIRSSLGDCNWMSHSGKLFWDYDQVNGQTPEPGDPVLVRYQGMYQMAIGGGDIVWDPSHGYWLRVFTFGGTGPFWQSTTSLSTGQWTAKTQVDVTALDAGMTTLYPSYSPERYASGLYYGTLGGRTGMWMWVPVDYSGCSNSFSGLGMVSVGLNFF